MRASAVRRFAVTAPAVLVLAAAVGCGGSGGSTGTAPSRSSAGATGGVSPSAGSASAGTPAPPAVKENWEAFFSPHTAVSRRVELLENGQQFAQVVKQEAGSSFARQTSATVSSATLEGPNRATVHYSILLGGKPVLSNQTGTAVFQGRVWKVGDASFCALLGLQGQQPSACASVTSSPSG